MLKPNRSDEKYWIGITNFDQIQYEDDLDEYIYELEEKLNDIDPYLISQTNELLDLLREEGKDVFQDSNIMSDSILSEACHIHDWRNYIPEIIDMVWNQLGERERLLVMLTAEAAANREDWD